MPKTTGYAILSEFQARVLRATQRAIERRRTRRSPFGRWLSSHDVAVFVYADRPGRLSNGARTATTVALHALRSAALLDSTLVPTFSAFESGFRWRLNDRGVERLRGLDLAARAAPR